MRAPESQRVDQARAQADFRRFTEIGQIFKMTQNRGKWHLI